MAEKGVNAAFTDNIYLDATFGSPDLGSLTEFDCIKSRLGPPTIHLYAM